MSLSRKHLAAFLLALVVACTDTPTEPPTPQQLPAVTMKLVLPPGLTPASYGIVIDTVEISIYQQDTTCGGDCCVECASLRARVQPTIRSLSDSTLLDSLIPWPTTSAGFHFEYELPPPPELHGYYMYIGLRANGQEMFYGYQDIAFERGRIQIPEIPLYYYGPGAYADDIQMFPGDTAMAVGDTLQFIATAYQGSAAVDTAYISWRVSDTTIAKVDHLGRVTVRSAALGGTFEVLAAIPNGIVARQRVSVPHTVTALQKISGDSQSVPIKQRLPAPLTVRAMDANGKPVAGARIKFGAVATPGIDLADSIVFTDPSGYARSAPVPTSPGVSTVQAIPTGLPAIHADFTTTGTTAVTRLVLFSADSGIGGTNLWKADADLGSRSIIAILGGGDPSLASPHWNPARNRVVFTSYNANANHNQLRLTTALGDSQATLVSDIDSYNGHFSPTGKNLAFICGADPTNEYNSDICVVQAVDGVMGGLNGAGDSASRLALSSLVPSRASGPGAFAWRPDASTRIAFARDSIMDVASEWIGSTIYQANADGSGLTLLSPRVMDLGAGPLKIVSSMSWSPDGTMIVFSAWSRDFGGMAQLYLLTVATGEVRQLTAPPVGWYGDRFPVFSPDGQRVLFQRTNYEGSTLYTDFFVVRTTGGTPSRITYDYPDWGAGYAVSRGGDWSPDGNSVVVTAPTGFNYYTAFVVPIDVTSEADYEARRVTVGSGNGSNSRDHAVSWGP